ncbi:Catalase [compost metagenome]
MSDRGTPYGYRFMHGFGSHTYSMLNAANERVFVKFHFKSMQGIKNFNAAEAQHMKAQDPDFAQRDLISAIDNMDFPKWKLNIQVMTAEESTTVDFNPFDLTKTWSQKLFPLIEAGVLELNQNPKNYFVDVEQSAFSPSRIVDGIGFSPDKMLQGRILSYPDAQRYRLGTNYELIPVNACPFIAHNYQRDGAMRIDSNGGDSPNYFPNSFDDITEDISYKKPAEILASNVADHYWRNAEGENDHYSQPGIFYRTVLTADEQKHLAHNIIDAMSGIDGPKRKEIITRQLCHFFRVDMGLGMAIANGLNIHVHENQPLIC